MEILFLPPILTENKLKIDFNLRVKQDEISFPGSFDFLYFAKRTFASNLKELYKDRYIPKYMDKSHKILFYKRGVKKIFTIFCCKILENFLLNLIYAFLKKLSSLVISIRFPIFNFNCVQYLCIF